jgi:signal transduction histidine kinase
MPSSRSILGPTGLLLLTIGALTLLFIDIGSIWLGSKTQSYGQALERAQQIRTLSGQLQNRLDDAETGQRGYLLTNDPSYLEPYTRAIGLIPKSLEALHLRFDRTSDEAELQQLASVIDDKLAEQRQTIQLHDNGHPDQALTLIKSGRGKQLMDQARTLIAGLVTASDADIRRSGADMSWSAGALQVTTIVGSVIVILLVTGTGFIVAGYARQLERASAEVETLNRDLEERVEERTADLMQANEEIQRFAYIVSHDLRSPLVNVMGFTAELDVGLSALQQFIATVENVHPELLTAEARQAANEDVPEALGFIRSSTAKMDRLINAILKLSREGRRVLTPEPVDMAALVAGIVASVRHQTTDAGAEIIVQDKLPGLFSDRLVLEQIFGNLIDNAVKYLDPSRPGRIQISARSEAGRLIYEVSDNGRGIDARDHERIFELFRRSGIQDRPGEGIGLAHVRALTRRLGGLIAVRSEFGRGTTFEINLPRVLPIQTESVAS